MSELFAKPDLALCRRVPKVCLHEHIDGGLRPTTMLELADKGGYTELPESEPEALADWFFRGASRGSLPEYLEGFRHTIALMQDQESLERVAYEALADFAAENVVYAELRFAPHFHTQKGLGLDGVMEAVLSGLERASEECNIGFGLIVAALRNQSEDLALELAELAVSWRARGCVGFDLAGEEAGHPAKDHLRAFQLVKRKNFAITIHAGESFGPESIWQALQYCGAHRLGHGTRLIEDIVVYEGKIIQVKTLAQYVLDHRIPLEICLSSNVHTGAAKSLPEHPFPYYLKQGYRVTLNTDNRLMSRTDMSTECHLAVQHYGVDLEGLELLAINGMKSAFAPYETRCTFIYDRIKTGYSQIYEELKA